MLAAGDTEQNKLKIISLAQLEAEIQFLAPGGRPLGLSGPPGDPPWWYQVDIIARIFFGGLGNNPSKFGACR